MRQIMRASLGLFAAFSLTACGTVPEGLGGSQTQSGDAGSSSKLQQIEYVPIQPFFSATYTDYSSMPIKEAVWAAVPKKDVRTYLPNQNSVTTIKRFEGESQVSYVVVATSVKGKFYEVLMEWSKYRYEPIAVSNDKTYGKVGVGMRVRANVEALEGGASLNGLVGLAAAVKGNKLRGSLSVELIGIDSVGVNSLLPINVNLDESSIQQALQTLAAVQTKIYDPDVLLTPHVLAIRNTSELSSEKDPAEKARSLVAPIK